MSGPRWRRVGWFYALSFALLLLVPGLHALTASGPMDFEAAAERASAETGLAWTSNLPVMIRLGVEEPSLFLLILGSAVLVPLIAACLLATLALRTAWGAPAACARAPDLFSPWLVPALLAALGLTNDAVGLSGVATMETALTPDHQITKALPLALLAAAVVAHSGRGLGRA